MMVQDDQVGRLRNGIRYVFDKLKLFRSLITIILQLFWRKITEQIRIQHQEANTVESTGVKGIPSRPFGYKINIPVLDVVVTKGPLQLFRRKVKNTVEIIQGRFLKSKAGTNIPSQSHLVIRRKIQGLQSRIYSVPVLPIVRMSEENIPFILFLLLSAALY